MKHKLGKRRGGPTGRTLRNWLKERPKHKKEVGKRRRYPLEMRDGRSEVVAYETSIRTNSEETENTKKLGRLSRERTKYGENRVRGQ